jgi:hypothetical protein
LILSFFLWLPDYSQLVLFFFGDNWTGLTKTINFFLFLSPVKVFVGFFAHIILLTGQTKFIALFKIIQFLILLIVLQIGFTDLESFLRLFVPIEVICDSVFIVYGYWLVKRAN